MAGRTLLSDTQPEVAAKHARLMAALSPQQRWQRIGDLNAAANAMALAGLRDRHPGATERELLLRLAVLRLGADLVAEVYGWRAGDGA